MIELTIQNLSLHHAHRVLLNSFSASFKGGDVVAIVGDNGSGKSTLLHALAGLSNSHQQIMIDGHDLSALSSLERAQSLTLLLQSLAPHPYSLAYSRIAQGLMPHFGFELKPREDCIKHITKIAQRLNISHLLGRGVAQMSGGEQRLVNIAKCLVNKQIKIIILDEPSVFLDFKQKNNLAINLQERSKDGGLIIFSTHDSDLIKCCANKVMAIDEKRAELLSKEQFLARLSV